MCQRGALCRGPGTNQWGWVRWDWGPGQWGRLVVGLLGLVLVPVVVLAADGDMSGRSRATTCMEPGPRCRDNPVVVGPCFTVSGRLLATDGFPDLRIVRQGTERPLGVPDPDAACYLPKAIADQLWWDRRVAAEFVVCPLTPARPGVLQLVCVEAASNARVEDPPLPPPVRGGMGGKPRDPLSP